MDEKKNRTMAAIGWTVLAANLLFAVLFVFPFWEAAFLRHTLRIASFIGNIPRGFLNFFQWEAGTGQIFTVIWVLVTIGCCAGMVRSNRAARRIFLAQCALNLLALAGSGLFSFARDGALAFRSIWTLWAPAALPPVLYLYLLWSRKKPSS